MKKKVLFTLFVVMGASGLLIFSCNDNSGSSGSDGLKCSVQVNKINNKTAGSTKGIIE